MNRIYPVGRCLLYGFEAISVHNGWAMALAGALIVFSGLVILSTVISQLYKILDFFEDRINRHKAKSAPSANEDLSNQPESKPDRENRFLDDLDGVIDKYKAASEPLGETFALTDLYRLAREMDAPHPHLTISYLKQHNFLFPLGDGIFSWHQ